MNLSEGRLRHPTAHYWNTFAGTHGLTGTKRDVATVARFGRGNSRSCSKNFCISVALCCTKVSVNYPIRASARYSRTLQITSTRWDVSSKRKNTGAGLLRLRRALAWRWVIEDAVSQNMRVHFTIRVTSASCCAKLT